MTPDPAAPAARSPRHAPLPRTEMRITGAPDDGWLPVDLHEVARAIVVLRGDRTARVRRRGRSSAVVDLDEATTATIALDPPPVVDLVELPAARVGD